MHLILGIIGENAEPLSRNARRVFGAEGGSIGRGRDCNWQLPDPTNTLSARHALITFDGKDFTITDTSTNGVYLNIVDAPLGRGNTAPLADGDTLYLANFIISVVIANDPLDEGQRPGLMGSKPVHAAAPPVLPPPLIAQECLDAPTASGSLGTEPKVLPDALLIVGERKPQAGVPPQVRDPRRPVRGGPAGKDAGALEPNLLSGCPSQRWSVPGTEVPFSRASLGKTETTRLPPAEPALVEQSRLSPSAFQDDSGGPLSGHPAPIIPEDLDLNDLWPNEPSRGGPPLPPLHANPMRDAPNTSFQVAREPLSPAGANDPGASLGPSTSAARLGEYELDQLAVLSERAPKRAVGAPDAGKEVPIPAPRSQATSRSAPDEFEVLWKTLGLNSSLVPPAQRRELLAELARALTEAVNGVQSRLAAWAAVRNEFHIEPRRMGSAASSHLFSFTDSGWGSLGEALAKQYGAPPLSRSVRKGFHHIKAHEVAALAAMRAAISNVLTHMSPQRIESDATNSGLFGVRLSKSKLWDRFIELHAAMVNDIDRTTRTYIAEEFTRSYELQLSARGEDEGQTT